LGASAVKSRESVLGGGDGERRGLRHPCQTQRPRLGTRVCRSFGTPMRELVFCPQHTIERRFGRQIFTLIRQAWDDLARWQVTKFR